MPPAGFVASEWIIHVVTEVAHRTVDALPSEWEVTRLAHRLREHLPEFRARYGLETVAVFGSYVRNEQHLDSDLDLLVTFSRTLDLIDLVGLRDELTELIGVPADVVMRSTLRPRLARYVLREAVGV